MDPLSHRISFRWQGRSITAAIVGIVGHVRHEGLDRAPRPEIFVPHAQVPFGSMTCVVRARGDAAPLIHAIKNEVWAVDPLQTFYSTTTVRQLLSDSVAGRRLSTAIVAGFAILALALAAVGIYGVINFLSTQRTQEFGIRLALGAGQRDIVQLVLGQGMLIASTGLGIGLIGALAISRVMRGLLFDVTPTDPITMGSVTAILLAVAAVASYLPARRATRVDPITAVRAE